ncbi:MAG: iron-containing alcohol dehydrogenase [Chloroflexota bacterium]
MRFEFSTATKIIFGAGTLKELEKLLPQYGTRAFVVSGSKPERAAPLLSLLDSNQIRYSIFPAGGEPSIDDARRGLAQARASDSDFVIAFGGGSVIDTGKAVAALLTNPGDPLDYLEVIGAGKPIKNASVPFIAIPTTAGTGSEVTSNAVLASPEHKVKVSLRSPLMLARLALVDSELTHSCPPDVTAYSGLDALTQVIEPFVSNKANPLTSSLCWEGIQRAMIALPQVYENGRDVNAREEMALVSLFGGIALANAKLGAVHGFAGPIGGMFDAPHGAICARLLPFVMSANIRALREREPNNPALAAYGNIATLFVGKDFVRDSDLLSPDLSAQGVSQLCEDLEVVPLSAYGITSADIPVIVEKSAVASSMQGNPIKLTVGEMEQILAEAL